MTRVDGLMDVWGSFFAVRLFLFLSTWMKNEIMSFITAISLISRIGLHDYGQTALCGKNKKDKKNNTLGFQRGPPP